MARLDIERQQRLEPIRMDQAKTTLEKMGFEVVRVSGAELRFYYKNGLVSFFPYSGWHSGKTIMAGRGLLKLLNQLT